MQYYEIVEKVRNNVTINASEITGKQMLMLIQDREIKRIKFDSILYEIYVIPTDKDVDYPVEIDDDFSYLDYINLLNQTIECYNDNMPVFIKLDDEIYEMIIDILETK